MDTLATEVMKSVKLINMLPKLVSVWDKATTLPVPWILTTIVKMSITVVATTLIGQSLAMQPMPMSQPLSMTVTSCLNTPIGYISLI